MGKNTMIMSMNIQILKTKITSNYNRSNIVKEKLFLCTPMDDGICTNLTADTNMMTEQVNQEVGTEEVN